MRLSIKTPKELLNPKDPLGVLTLVLTLVALSSTFLLDYLNFRQNKTSYFPWSVSSSGLRAGNNIAGKQKPESRLAEFINQTLKESGLAEESITKERTEEELVYFSVKTSEPEYKRIKEKLRSGLKKQGIRTRIKEEKSQTGEIIASMEMRQQARTSGWVIFRYAQDLSLRRVEKKEPVRKVAIVIDDMGVDLKILQELISLKTPLTVAVLPDTLHARETSELASKNGLEVIIHLPLEAFNEQPGSAGAEGLIKTSMSYQDVWSILEKDYERVPEARGLNNHMGSKATADEQLMEIIMTFLKEKNLFFLDSRTSNRSIAYDLAIKKKIPAASRQVFLDADEDRSKIKDRLSELFYYARKNGQAVGIGHPYPETVQVLKTYLPQAEQYGIKLVTVSSIIKK